jgi:replicative DNA helicase
MTTPDFFINEVRKFKKKYPLDFIVIDYLSSNLVQSGLGLPTHEDLGMITKELKNLAKREDLIIITAAQSNRKSLEKDNAGLENISYSDMIGHNCDFVAFIKKGKIASDVISLNIAKNREGAKDIDMKFKMNWATNTMADTINVLGDGHEHKHKKFKRREDTV